MKKFWIKLIVFLLFSLVIPCAYLSIRFELFKSKQIITLPIWAIIILAILTAVMCIFIKYYLSGLKTRYSLIKQVLEGFIKIIVPVAFILFVVIWFKGKGEWLLQQTNTIIEVLSVFLISWSVAIVVNPLPKWAFDNNVEGLSEIADKIFHKGGNE